MIISIGSRSMPKIIAITRAFSRYPELWMEKEDEIKYIITSTETRKDENKGQDTDKFSGVSCNPLTLSETIQGAKNRAKNAFDYGKAKEGNCTFGVGIEARHV